MYLKQRFITLMLVVVIGLLSACGQLAQTSGDVPSAPTAQATEAVAPTEDVEVAEPTPEPEADEPDPTPAAEDIKPVEVPLAATDGLTVTYAQLEWTVTEGVIDNKRASFDVQGGKDRTDEYHTVRLTVEVENNAGRLVNVDNDLATLQLADGEEQEMEDVLPTLEIPNADATEQSVLVFSVPVGTAWEGVKLVLQEANREAAVLPLDGTAPATVAVQTLPSTGEATVEDVQYTIRAARLDLDYGGKRVETDKRFLKFDMRVTNNGTGGGGLPLTPDHFRLQIDGAMVAPEAAPIEVVRSNSSHDGLLVFSIPASTRTTALQVGDSTGDKFATIALDVGGSQAGGSSTP